MLGESAGRARNSRVRPTAVRRMDDDERALVTPMRDGSEEVPLDGIPIGMSGAMQAAVWGFFIIANILIAAIFAMMVTWGGAWVAYAIITFGLYAGLASGLAFARRRLKPL